MLTRRCVLAEEMGQTYLADPDVDGNDAPTLRPLQAVAVTHCIAFGPRSDDCFTAANSGPRMSLKGRFRPFGATT